MEGLIIISLVGGGLWLYFYSRQKQKESMQTKVSSLATAHQAALGKKRQLSVHEDDYGRVIYDRWDDEITYFLEHIVIPTLSAPEREALKRELAWAVKVVEDSAREEHIRRVSQSEYSDELSPMEFEHYCADVLEQNGWEARVTKTSGDQGVDVLAERDGMRVALQCKKYSKPVGNKAIQEVFAARTHEGADYAAVVTNTTFTPSAKQLAASTGVLLLHVDDLPELWHILIGDEVVQS